MNGLEALERLMSKYNEMCLDTGCNDDEYQNGNNTSERAIIEKELKAFEIIKNHAKENKHFKYLLYMAKYWEENKIEVTEELLRNYDFPYTIDEFNLLKEMMK